jgi:hypothetical protein
MMKPSASESRNCWQRSYKKAKDAGDKIEEE